MKNRADYEMLKYYMLADICQLLVIVGLGHLTDKLGLTEQTPSSTMRRSKGIYKIRVDRLRFLAEL